ncbi:hypothetical protein BU24DRAFT_422638 [Aaosphaeria arxii CBS 175.79]|uniref:RNI-like protein n=1 Tax=Aaosphaeria arxii CBS 175.79 TaxID=1450172 RepID=A0A6A5XTR0_9PLEO|nr:uncharacterized protein BU24DRAFT_422638 [Aaosphaeria arxii CBS 175.79]KAF2016299.1 hypothetical protein BU24DRAFT_422638 [Aaosphaeria arxii CBS 175.79]
MSAALPDDIFHLLCEELAVQKDFDTLFACACAGRILAVPALTNLYRSHHLAPIIGGGEDEAVPFVTKQLLVLKWSILWKSIIASSLNATLFPYCRYIKHLDFRDLQNLFYDDKFRGKVSNQFFSGPLSRFHMTERVSRGKRNFDVLNVVPILDAIGEEVTKHTPMIEVISGKLVSSALVRWAPRIPRLQTLELEDGVPLEDELVHASIQQHCPHFSSLSIFGWAAQERDHKLSTFLSALRPQSLRSLETIRDIGVGAETFLALSTHSKSLKELELCISEDALPHLSLLQGCTALENLRIEDTLGTTNLEKTQNDVFLDMVSWLRNCSNIRRISFSRLQSASAIITPLCLDPTIKIRQLELNQGAYVPKDCQTFHQALANQASSLEDLSLTGDTDGMFRDDIDIIVDSLKQLTQLRELKLVLVQEVFHDEHLISILGNMKLLEDVYITGMEIKDEVLDCVAKLDNLKSVSFSGISKFTTDGLLEFVSELGPGNRGIRVMVDMADPETLLSDEEVNLVRESLWEKAGGTLEYIPFKDPNVPDFDESDSD